MRFFLDHDVDARVCGRLHAAGHEAWSAADAGLNEVSDDALTVYAQEHGAILVTHDREFSRRRRRNAVGWHVHMRCHESQAADLLLVHARDLEALVDARSDLFVAISTRGMNVAPSRWT